MPSACPAAGWWRRSVTICFLVNGARESAVGERARRLSQPLEPAPEVKILYRQRSRLLSLLDFLKGLRQFDPDVVYVLNIGYAGAGAALLAKPLLGFRLIVDTGDVVYELDKLIRVRTSLGIQCVRALEKLALEAADVIVVRGSYHKSFLESLGYTRVFHIPDGVDTSFSMPLNVSELRERLDLEGYLTVGVMGSTIWSERLQMCYGWELVEILKLLKDQPVKAVMVGDGTGLSVLREQARQEGLEDRIVFTGRVPYAEIPRYVNLMDICLSTQTDNLVGQVRTTGKLPEYLACGRYILATDVGEAKLVLPEHMLVRYEGVKDATYPARLAERIAAILENPVLLEDGAEGVATAKTLFDYRVLGKRLEKILASLDRQD